MTIRYVFTPKHKHLALAQKLLKILRDNFSESFLIKVTSGELADMESNQRHEAINIHISNSKFGGEATENWSIEYVETLLKKPKEMDLAIERWVLAFNEDKKGMGKDLIITN